jgi:hypothetical protein
VLEVNCLPCAILQTDKSTVVSEIIKYIKGLQLKLDELNKRRADALSRKPIDVTGSNLKHPSSNLAGGGVPPNVSNESCLQSFVMPNVALHISGSNAFITMSSKKKKGIFARILLIMQSHKLDVINAHISTSSGTVFHCLHVLVSLIHPWKLSSLDEFHIAYPSPALSLKVNSFRPQKYYCTAVEYLLL